MIEVSVQNTSGVTIRSLKVTEVATSQAIAEWHAPLPARASQSFTVVRTVPPGAVGTWPVQVDVSWEDENAFRGRRRSALIVRME